MKRSGVVIAAFTGLLFSLASLASTAAGNPDVPVQAAALLERRCLSCHDAQRKMGGIDLSTRAGFLALGELSAADLEAHRLVKAITTGKMPPAGKLPAAELATLREWVRSGASYPRPRLGTPRAPEKPLWSLQPVRRPPVPATPWDHLSRNPIDRFLFAKLAQQGLKPSPPASRLALLRRVTVDLTGLPPTPEEVATFLKDCEAEDRANASAASSTPGRLAAHSHPQGAHSRAQSAYEKLVDRLLASPAYGERWGQHWLDVVRYGESNGYERNLIRPASWPYRDYVIRSFNQDKPFDRFVLEQLAGDVVGKGDPDVEVATGFLVAGVHDDVGIATEEGTRSQRANDLDDIATTTVETFQALTLGCARCHDHKFDPIPQKDYYQLCSVFAGVRHSDRALSAANLSPERRRAVEVVAQQLRKVEADLGSLDTTARLAVLRARGIERPLRPAVSPLRNVETFEPVRARYVRFTIAATQDGSQPCVDELEIYGADGTTNLALASGGAKAAASSALPGYAIHQIPHLNDGKKGNDHSWISAEAGKGWAQIALPAEVTISRVVWSRDGAEPSRYSDRVASAYEVSVSLDGQNWRPVANGADRETSASAISEEALLAALTPAQQRQRKELTEQLAALRRRELALRPPGSAYVGQFSAPDRVFVLHRGDVMQRGEEVRPGGLSQFPGFPGDLTRFAPAGASPTTPLGDPERRLALARWLVDPRNPLTARVMVNRVWHYHFGRGLVATPSDFGRNGEKPTHPELLDYLATLFSSTSAAGPAERVESGSGRVGTLPSAAASGSQGSRSPQNWGAGGAVRGSGSSFAPTPTHPHTHTPIHGLGWSLKRLHKLIVTSYAYRQSSAPEPKAMAADAGNRYLWRMPLRRMEAEAVRDAILATSGKLDREMGGPSYQLFKYQQINVAFYEPLDEHRPETWRRSVYRMSVRAIRDDLLSTFDCPETATRTPKRENTTTALQALSLLNGSFMVQQSGFLAERIRKEAGDAPNAQIDRAFRLTLGRPPTPKERASARALVQTAGLPALTRALLNANEFLYY